MILYFLYLISVLFSAVVLYKDYLRGLDRGYKFSLQEKIVGLFIVPFLPVLNLIVGTLILMER